MVSVEDENMPPDTDQIIAIAGNQSVCINLKQKKFFLLHYLPIFK